MTSDNYKSAIQQQLYNGTIKQVMHQCGVHLLLLKCVIEVVKVMNFLISSIYLIPIKQNKT